ncbi:MAG: DUF2931 family protein [Pseudomonas sp.]
MNKPSALLKCGIALLLVFSLGGCTLAGSRSLPYDAWRLGFGAPSYMEVWIETADVVDINGYVFRRAGSGTAAISTPANFKGNPSGWPKNPAWGKGKYVRGADLPRLLYVRWQSLVEPQTYEAYIKIPESARVLMRKGEKLDCDGNGKLITDYREAIVVGLAPGGIAKVWVTGPCLSSIEVARVQGTVNPRGPYEGKSGGHHRPLTEESKAYVEKFGVPYGSW